MANADSRADIHAVPDLYTLAHVDTDTCAYCHGNTDADADSDGANADTGTNCYRCTHSDTGRHAYANTGSSNADT